MKTVIIMPCLFRGGAETQFRMLFEQLVKEDETYIIAIKHSQSTPEYNKFKQLYSSHIIELFKRVKINALTIVFINLFLLLYIVRLRFRGIRNVVVIETYWLLFVSLLRKMSINIVYSERNNGIHKLRYMYKLIEQCNYITTNSEEAKEILERFIDKKTIEVINNGVNVVSLKTPPLKHSNGIFKIVVPARIHPIKNQLFVVEALSKTKGIEVHFAGSIGDDHYYECLIKAIQRLHKSDVFTCDGFVDNWLEKYKDFDLVLLPSLAEGTSNVILESFANSRLILASDIAMNKRLIKDDKCLFISENALSLEKSILQVMQLTDKEFHHILQINYEYVVQNYAVKNMVNAFRCKLQ